MIGTRGRKAIGMEGQLRVVEIVETCSRREEWRSRGDGGGSVTLEIVGGLPREGGGGPKKEG